jgi:hypothetical protein
LQGGAQTIYATVFQNFVIVTMFACAGNEKLLHNWRYNFKSSLFIPSINGASAKPALKLEQKVQKSDLQNRTFCSQDESGGNQKLKNFGLQVWNDFTKH